jgi:hypothetical protein
MNLNDRALLVSLNIGGWSGRRIDKRVTQDIASANGVTTSAGRYNKSLLPNCDLLSDIQQKDNHIRAKFYENTLPWGVEGQQILPVSNYLTFMNDFRREKAERTQLVSNFVSQYDALRVRAQTDLGPLFNPDDYPDSDRIAEKFYMDLQVMPVPTTDFRVQISSEELTRIQQDVETRVQKAQNTAMNDLWQRVFDKVKHIAEKCADPKAIFRDSMIENARELCELLPRLNFADDPHLETMRQEIEAKLLRHPEALRTNPVLRQDTAIEAKAIMDKMSVFMGAN